MRNRQFTVGNRLSLSKKGLDAGSANKLVHTQLPSLLESVVWGQLTSFAQTTVTWSHFTHSLASRKMTKFCVQLEPRMCSGMSKVGE